MSPTSPTLPVMSLVIPAFNEAVRLPATLTAVTEAMAGWPFASELVLVNDGSSDETPDILRSWAAREPRIVVVSYDRNRGKGAAVSAGVAVARGRYVVFFDADLSYPLAAVPDALALFEGGAPGARPDLVIGARDLEPTDGRAEYGPVRRLSSTAFNTFVEVTLRLGVRDTQCGFKAFRGDVARALFAALEVRGFGFDVELLHLARRWGLHIALMPLKMRAREGSSVNLVRHSLQMARDVLRIRMRSWLGRYPSGPRRAR